MMPKAGGKTLINDKGRGPGQTNQYGDVGTPYPATPDPVYYREVDISGGSSVRQNSRTGAPTTVDGTGFEGKDW